MTASKDVVNVRLVALPPDQILMPGIVMRMGVPIGQEIAPLATEDFRKVKAAVPFLTPSELLFVAVPEPPSDDYNRPWVGTLARVITQPNGDTKTPMIVQGLSRVQVTDANGLNSQNQVAQVTLLREPNSPPFNSELIDRLKSSVTALFAPWDKAGYEVVKRFLSFTEGISSPSTLVDVLVSVLPLEYSQKYDLLAETDPTTRIKVLITAIQNKAEQLKRQNESKPASNALVRLAPPKKTVTSQTPAVRPLRPVARREDDDDDGLGALEETLKKANLPADGRKIVDRELRRMKRMNSAQAEYQVARTFLETIADLPWNNTGTPNLSPGVVDEAREILDNDHYGLQKAKKRLLEYLAVMYLQQTHAPEPAAGADGAKNDGAKSDGAKSDGPVKSAARTPILLLVGPPGVGKTSLAKSVAHALNRKLQRISLGGVRDEAEIRGHRRTYIGSMPGVIVQALRKAGTMNPVFVLDEIDKVGQGNHGTHGDPSAALLEVLDPEQNSSFVDHYMSFPVDLSHSIFIATANSTDTIPPALLDRLEVIHIEGYTYLEKQFIAENYLLPKQERANALNAGQVTIPPDVIHYIATHYTRESGVRSLERALGTICRGVAVELLSEGKPSAKVTISVADLQRYLGLERIHDDVVNDEVDSYVNEQGDTVQRSSYGLVNGLAYMGSGTGGLLMFESTLIPNGSGKLKLTGKLGKVIQESAEIALSWVRSHAADLGIDSELLAKSDIHLHAPAGAIPKDGPSAGVAMALSYVSLLTKQVVPRDIAMTGEITLRGKILPVGGVREKLLGAHMAGVHKVLLPYHCRSVVEDECEFVKDLGMQIIYVKYIWDVFSEIWPNRFHELAHL